MKANVGDHVCDPPWQTDCKRRGGEGKTVGVGVEVVDGGERRNVVVLSKWSEW